MTISEQSRGDRRPVASVATPFLALDPERMERNITRLENRLEKLGVALRPHMKTHKSLEVGKRMSRGISPITVSTLREAEEFARAGFRDITYAVGIAPSKLDRVEAFRRSGVDLSVIIDSVEQAEAVADASRRSGDRIPALIEIDADGHRAGLTPDDPAILEVARALVDGGAELRGVLVHAGESYGCTTPDELAAAAENERAAVVSVAERLRAAGHPCPVVSVGSTPTSHFARNLDGVTEVRAGVYIFQDLVMAGIGVCELDDIAVSVVATVIGHRPEKGWIITDAGWMAMSRDRGTASQAVDQGYGVVTAMDGTPFEDLIVARTSQEHGTMAIRPGSAASLPELPVGTRVRVYPNHACATTAQHERYAVFPTGSDEVTADWEIFRGW
ncbi:MAG TPA: DSD1 family PLP-dependent enzyme [Gemmatimonadaceae bacterium]|nr:DSD1 family PLP-dependent enzyme [Gemmatimonadaceae bacterium]